MPDGVRVSAGKLSQIQVNREFIKKMEPPYSDCVSNDDPKSAKYAKSGDKYTSYDCVDLCYQRYVYDRCGCVDLQLNHPNDLPACVNVGQYTCDVLSYIRFFTTRADLACRAMCPLECHSMIYSLTLSSSDFPSRVYANVLVNYTNISRFFPDKKTPLKYEDLKENLAAVYVNYNRLDYTLIEEVEKITFIDFISSVGGTLGLFIGMSFLSIVELVELFIELVFLFSKPKIMVATTKN